jgi:pimeloyl-ACP methyl ester carboxylesterase
MRVDIGGGVRLYVDIDGFGLVPADGKLVERPTLILLHGGPGLDHATFKLGLTELRDAAQVLVYDHRGHGRSDWRTSDEWNLDTWADDIVRLCTVLGIEKPVVLGNSFGGFVAQRYIGRHPDHPSKVVLSSTVPRWQIGPAVAMFTQLGGPDAGAIAKRFWTDPTDATRADYMRVCGPLYTQTPGNLFDGIATIRNSALFSFWNAGEN